MQHSKKRKEFSYLTKFQRKGEKYENCNFNEISTKISKNLKKPVDIFLETPRKINSDS